VGAPTKLGFKLKKRGNRILPLVKKRRKKCPKKEKTPN
jgi:hypothetical protein